MSGSWLSALAIITRRFIPPDKCIMIVLRLSHSDRRLSSSSILAFARLAEQPAPEAHGPPHRLECVRRQLLRDQADAGPRVADNRVCQFLPSTSTSPSVGGDDAADDVDHRRLAGAIGTEKRENLAFADVEIDRLQRLDPVA